MRPILCAVDFSDHSKCVLRWAAALAARRHARLIVLYAVDPLLAHVAHARLGISLVDADAGRELQQFVGSALKHPAGRRATHTMKIEVGEPAPTILQTAARLRAQVIVMGTHGLSGLRKLLLGSTAARVLSRTTIPLLMVPSPDDSLADAQDPLQAMTRILVATDFEATADSAVEWAATLARASSIPMTLVHVVKPVSVPERWRSYVAAADEAALDRARRRLADLPALGGDPAPVCEPVATLGDPAETIATLARDRHAGLIVMGLANRRNPAGIKPGTVAYGVVRLSHLPVVVVPPRIERRARRAMGGREESRAREAVLAVT